MPSTCGRRADECGEQRAGTAADVERVPGIRRQVPQDPRDVVVVVAPGMREIGRVDPVDQGPHRRRIAGATVLRMRTILVTGDALALDDVVAVARRRARAELGPDVAAADGAQPAAWSPTRSSRTRSMYGVTHRLRRARRHPRRPRRPRADAAGADPLARRRRRRRRCPTTSVRGAAAAAGPDAHRRLLRRPRRAAGAAARAARPRPAAGRSPARARSARPATWPSSPHLAQPLVGEGRLRRRGDPPRAARAELLAEEGSSRWCSPPKEGLSLINGTEPMQVLLALAIDEIEAAGQGRRHRVRAERRVAARHRPRVRRAGAGDPAASRASWPAPPTCGRLLAGSPLVASHRRERPRRAGLLLPALRAAGARRGPRRARARPPASSTSSSARSSTTR